MKSILFALLIIGVCASFSVSPDYLGIKDTGGMNLSPLEVNITIDCETKDLSVDVRSNATGEPMIGANLYLFYTQYEYQLIATGKTGSDGIGTVNVIGNRDYLTRMFILRADKSGYQSREMEFTYKKCFDAPPKPPANASNQAPPANNTQNSTPPSDHTNNTTNQTNSTAMNSTTPIPPKNETSGQNAISPANESGQQEPAPPRQGICPIGLAIFSLLFYRSRI